MLRYHGWFKEPVPDSPLESWRVRKVQLLYYLEDGERGLGIGSKMLPLRAFRPACYPSPMHNCPSTPPLWLPPPLHPAWPTGSMQVTEPAEPNSGLVQGTLVRRHKIPRQGGGMVGLADLAVGSSIAIYGRCV